MIKRHRLQKPLAGCRQTRGVLARKILGEAPQRPSMRKADLREGHRLVGESGYPGGNFFRFPAAKALKVVLQLAPELRRVFMSTNRGSFFFHAGLRYPRKYAAERLVCRLNVHLYKWQIA
jgi:hypothetical protein